MSETRCDRCGAVLQVGSFPFCRFGPSDHEPRIANVISDAIDEWNENVGHEPVHFTSRSERKRYLKEHGLIEFVRHIGEPGSDRSSKTSRWI